MISILGLRKHVEKDLIMDFSLGEDDWTAKLFGAVWWLELVRVKTAGCRNYCYLRRNVVINLPAFSRLNLYHEIATLHGTLFIVMCFVYSSLQLQQSCS